MAWCSVLCSDNSRFIGILSQSLSPLHTLLLTQVTVCGTEGRNAVDHATHGGLFRPDLPGSDDILPYVELDQSSVVSCEAVQSALVPEHYPPVFQQHAQPYAAYGAVSFPPAAAEPAVAQTKRRPLAIKQPLFRRRSPCLGPRRSRSPSSCLPDSQLPARRAQRLHGLRPLPQPQRRLCGSRQPRVPLLPSSSRLAVLDPRRLQTRSYSAAFIRRRRPLRRRRLSRCPRSSRLPRLSTHPSCSSCVKRARPWRSKCSGSRTTHAVSSASTGRAALRCCPARTSPCVRRARALASWAKSRCARYVANRSRTS